MKVIIALFFALGFSAVSSELRIESQTYADFPSTCNNRNMNPFFRIGRNYYYVQSSERLSWFAAAHFCRSLNADLATIRSNEEMVAIQNYLISRGFGKGSNFWVAANDLTSVFHFEWISNGKPVTYTKWSSGQPDNYRNNERCVFLWRIGTQFFMNDDNCIEKQYFICQAQTPKTVAVTVW